jgi:hypothetical protein
MTLTQSVAGWVRFGFCPIELRAADWGVPGCVRRVLVATHCGHGDQDLFLGEYDSREELDRARRAYRGVITRTWNRLTK